MPSKRMICFISAQPLPNFIPVNETATCPDVLHCIYTPRDPAMQQRWDALRATLKKAFPKVEVQGVKIKDAYDARGIQKECFSLLREYPQDEWSLNATGGTKLMSAPAIEVFRLPELREMELGIYYVESSRHYTLKIERDWTTQQLPFQSSIDLETYFSLYGRKVETAPPLKGQETNLFQQLQKLDWQVWSSVRLRAKKLHPDDDRDLAEYDAIGIRGNQLSAFECKSLAQTSDPNEQKKKLELISKDTYKLFQVRQAFGGPFGKSYWVFAGSWRLTPSSLERLKLFSVQVIRQSEINLIGRDPDKFGLPPIKPQTISAAVSPSTFNTIRLA